MGGQQSSSRSSRRNRSRSSTTYDQGVGVQYRNSSRERIKFHKTHGKNITLEQNGKVARRHHSFCYGIVFSDRPLRIGERATFKLSSIQVVWSGVMRIGFTRKNPSGLVGSELPRYACPDLTNRPGFWAKAIPDDFAVENNVFTVSVNRHGALEYSVNGEDSGTLFNGIDTNCPLWLMLDVYGNAVALELLDNVSQVTSSSEILNDVEMFSAQPAPELSIHEAFQIPANIAVESMKFSTVCGSAVDISNDKLTCFKQITRRIYSFTILHPSSISFTDIPFTPGMTWYLRIKSKSLSHQGYDLGIGVTSVNPGSLTPEEFPADSEDLIDRPEYWIINKNLSFPREGEYFSILMGADGHVTCKHQGGTELSLFFVDISRPLWLILDLCGNVHSILSAGYTSPPPTPTSILDPHQIAFNEGGDSIRTLNLDDSSSSEEDDDGGALSWQQSSSSSESDSMEVVEHPTNQGRGILGAIAGGLVFGISTGIVRSLLRSRSGAGDRNGGVEFDGLENGGNESENGRLGSENGENSFENARNGFQNGRNDPENGGNWFENGGNSSGIGFQNGRNNQENGGNWFENGGNNPENGGNWFENGENNSENSESDLDVAVIDTSGDEYETAHLQSPQKGRNNNHTEATPSSSGTNTAVSECVICFDAEPDTALYDCGHKCLCDGCATTLMKQRFPKCPICRKRIKDKLKVYG